MKTLLLALLCFALIHVGFDRFEQITDYDFGFEKGFFGAFVYLSILFEMKRRDA